MVTALSALLRADLSSTFVEQPGRRIGARLAQVGDGRRSVASALEGHESFDFARS